MSPQLQPCYPLGQHTQEPPSTRAIISALNLLAHPEGGYFSEIDRDPLTIPNPFLNSPSPPYTTTAALPFSGNATLRNASTSIFYLLTRVRPQGHFHRNKGRTVHTVIRGRGRYVLIHDDEGGDGASGGGTKRVEHFVVGRDVARGERAVWIVEGGKYKASYLLPDSEEEEGGGGGGGGGGGRVNGDGDGEGFVD